MSVSLEPNSSDTGGIHKVRFRLQIKSDCNITSSRLGRTEAVEELQGKKKDVKIISISVTADSHVRGPTVWRFHVPSVSVWVVFGTPASCHRTKTSTEGY